MNGPNARETTNSMAPASFYRTAWLHQDRNLELSEFIRIEVLRSWRVRPNFIRSYVEPNHALHNLTKRALASSESLDTVSRTSPMVCPPISIDAHTWGREVDHPVGVAPLSTPLYLVKTMLTLEEVREARAAPVTCSRS